MSTLLIALVGGLGVAALVGGVTLIFRGGSDDSLESRLDALAGLNKGGAKHAELEKALLASSLDDVPGQIEKLIARMGNLRLLMEQANVDMAPTKMLAIIGVLFAAGVVGMMVAGFHWGLGFGTGACLATLPILWLFFARSRRYKAFAQQLPEALELISRALRAGHSLQSGFSLAGDEMTDPIAAEFARVFEEQNLGVPLEEALDAMTERVPNLDLKFFATAVVLQRQTGGDLAEILDKIGTLVRARFRIYGQIQALTGEGRLSGIVLLALPPVLFVVMLRLNYEYASVLWTDPMGMQMLGFAIFMQFLGAIVIRKIVNIKV